MEAIQLILQETKADAESPKLQSITFSMSPNFSVP